MKKFLLASGGIIGGFASIYSYAYYQSNGANYGEMLISEVTNFQQDPAANKVRHCSNFQRIVIIGAGIIGITSAYYMQKEGKDVTVIEERSGPALKTSFKNGCIVTPGLYTRPW